MGALNELRDRWTKEAEDLRSRYGREDLARLCEVHAQELLAAQELVKDELWTVGRAAAEGVMTATTSWSVLPRVALRLQPNIWFSSGGGRSAVSRRRPRR